MHAIETVGVCTFGTKHSNGTRFALEDEHKIDWGINKERTR
jgi:hypothetical protein